MRRSARSRLLTCWLALPLSLLPMAAAHAVTIASVSPQGEVAQVQQVVVKFSEAVVAFGSPQLPDPVAVTCTGTTAEGSGRWSSDRVWLYDFKRAPGPGTRCTVEARAGWQPGAAAGSLTGTRRFGFQTGGPAIVRWRPWPGSQVAEDQHFLLTLSGPAVESSVLAHAGCEVEGIGDRLPLRVVSGAAREALLKSERIARAQAANTLVVACVQPLPSDTPMRLVWGAGIAAQADPRVVTRVEQREGYRVRPAFTAEFSCERERANAPCLPIRPLRLGFSAPIDRALAERVRLVSPAGAVLAPKHDKDDQAVATTAVEFPNPLPENTVFNIELPPGLTDDAGRPLANAGQFPLKVATGDAPPIAKFATAPFGVIELGTQSMLPITLRHVQGDLRPGAATGQVRIKSLQTDADILAWLARVGRFHETQLTAREAGRPEAEWFDVERVKDARGRITVQRTERYVATREVSLLADDASAARMELPQLVGGDPRPFEVVGLPIAQPGYHVVEVASARLGQALLDKAAPEPATGRSRAGAAPPGGAGPPGQAGGAWMYVRTGVLVTNLGVHFKRGRESSAVWVTSLDRGRPVADADLVVRDCRGQQLWAGRSDAQGVARITQVLDAGAACRGAGSDEEAGGEGRLFVSARKAIASGPAKGRIDTAFVFSDWQQGIEPWRFDVATRSPAYGEARPELRAHTVFDRTLLRAGETVSMKHFVRAETDAGLAAVPAGELPTRMKITHQGSGEEQVQPLRWTGTRQALASWNIPAAAKLGAYEVSLEREPPSGAAADENPPRSWPSGSFRIEAFRVPLLDVRVSPPKTVPVAPREVAIGVQLNYQSGGAVTRAPLAVSALLSPRAVSFAGVEGFSFEPPRAVDEPSADEAEAAATPAGRLVADKLAATTDANGAATVALKDLPAIERPSELLAEVSFSDPNSEVQTASTRVNVWPSAVVVGLQAGSWVSQRGKASFKAIALNTAGQPLAGQAIDVRGRLVQTITTRKRMVGGFYAYDNRNEVRELGTLCTGRSDAQGLVSCEAALDVAGQVELIAHAKDDVGRAVQAATSVWVTRQGELWFAQDNDDRIDLLPEKRRYEPGETARLQLRMPYREATAWVAVEREGVITTRVATLRGDDPTIELKIEPGWGPNVYVSVLAVRGRVREVPWYSFFSWGWQAPLEWLRAYRFEGKDYQAPTAMVDLSKPSFKLGMAALEVGIAEHALQVAVSTDQPQYAVRQRAVARIKVTHAGKPFANGEVAFAAVDEGLLALRDNASWDLLGAMFQRRPWSVETSTAQSEIIGRRHYGRKAVAAGGGGGRGAARELFDTLLLWRGVVALDANGEATVEVPLNDSLTSFRFVAIADDGAQRFGSGTATVRVTQDLQMLAGLPPLVREGDRYTALLTVRNTTAREMKLRATLAGTANVGSPGAAAIDRTPITLAPQDVVLAAGAAKELSWDVDVPAGAFSIAWEAAADEQGTATDRAKDRLKLMQLVTAAVPVRVLQGDLQRLDSPLALPVAPPADALAANGVTRVGLVVGLQPKLSGALPGLRRYFETYPFTCLEQQASKAVGLKDAALWQAVADALPTYLDADGLASPFPPRSGDGARGSDRLTAYLIAATHEAGFALPEAARARMLDGLTAFVEGRIERRFWAPAFAAGRDLDVRKIAAIEALSRHGRANARQLGSVKLAPNTWPTAAVIDWLAILKRVKGIPEQAKRLEEAHQILRARLAYAGTTLKFSTEDEDFWWWLMDSADANAAKLILATVDDPAWQADLPRLVTGSLARQKRGAWVTTTANLWGALALDKFSAKFESVPVGGVTTARTGDGAAGRASIDWQKEAAGGSLRLPWPASAGTLDIDHAGAGAPWVTVQALAAIPLRQPLNAGYVVTRSVSAVQQKQPGRWGKGDVMRVKLVVDAQSDMTWVVIADPVPGGATVLGSGLGRDSAIAAQGERREGTAWPAYEERSSEAFRSYHEFLPRGRHVVEYTLRLNNAGRFGLPPTRVEAMYAPERFGETPNEAVDVAP